MQHTKTTMPDIKTQPAQHPSRTSTTNHRPPNDIDTQPQRNIRAQRITKQIKHKTCRTPNNETTSTPQTKHYVGERSPTPGPPPPRGSPAAFLRERAAGTGSAQWRCSRWSARPSTRPPPTPATPALATNEGSCLRAGVQGFGVRGLGFGERAMKCAWGFRCGHADSESRRESPALEQHQRLA